MRVRPLVWEWKQGNPSLYRAASICGPFTVFGEPGNGWQWRGYMRGHNKKHLSSHIAAQEDAETFYQNQIMECIDNEQ